MSKRSSKTSYVLDLITKKSNPENLTDEGSVKPTWMAPGEFQDTITEQKTASYAENEDNATKDQLQSELKKQYQKKDIKEPEKAPLSNSTERLKKMIGHTDEDDPVSDKIKSSLELFIKEEMSEPDDDEPKLSTEGDVNNMTVKKERHKLSPLGDSFEYKKPDTIKHDLENTSLGDENDREGMSEPDPQSFIFVNVAEEIVRSKVPAIMEDYKMCKCNRCTNDVVALALNKISPRYVVTEKGKLYARINACLPQYQADLLESIVSACETVKANTRHKQQSQD